MVSVKEGAQLFSGSEVALKRVCFIKQQTENLSVTYSKLSTWSSIFERRLTWCHLHHASCIIMLLNISIGNREFLQYSDPKTTWWLQVRAKNQSSPTHWLYNALQWYKLLRHSMSQASVVQRYNQADMQPGDTCRCWHWFTSPDPTAAARSEFGRESRWIAECRLSSPENLQSLCFHDWTCQEPAKIRHIKA